MQYFREASATILSQRDSEFTYLTLKWHFWPWPPASAWVHTWEPEGQVSDQWAMWPATESLHSPQDSLLTAPSQYLKRIPENYLPTKARCPPKPSSEKAQLSVFSRFGLVSFKCSSANMNGVASLCRHSPSSCVHWWHVLCDSTPRSEHRCRTDVCYWTSEQRESSTM